MIEGVRVGTLIGVNEQGFFGSETRGLAGGSARRIQRALDQHSLGPNPRLSQERASRRRDRRTRVNPARERGPALLGAAAVDDRRDHRLPGRTNPLDAPVSSLSGASTNPSQVKSSAHPTQRSGTGVSEQMYARQPRRSGIRRRRALRPAHAIRPPHVVDPCGLRPRYAADIFSEAISLKFRPDCSSLAL